MNLYTEYCQNIRYHEGYDISTIKLELLVYVRSTTFTCMKSRLFHVNDHKIYHHRIKAIYVAIVEVTNAIQYTAHNLVLLPIYVNLDNCPVILFMQFK